MKTIAISIDEATLTGFDRLAQPAEGPGLSTRALMFKRKLSTFVGSLSPFQIEELNRATAVSLDLPAAP
jgi:hypothetical protein